MQSQAAMFQLFMPEQLYNPDAEQQSALARAPMDRRHHYIWAFEPRRLVNQHFNDKSEVVVRNATSKTTLQYFY